jgi:hypothetical protein
MRGQNADSDAYVTELIELQRQEFVELVQSAQPLLLRLSEK